MTKKTLSQKICEECGIEEQKILVVGFDEYDITLPIFKTVKQTSDEPCIRVVREHCLPNFENNNNNFVKLEEIMLAELAEHHLTVVKWVHYWLDGTLMHEYILITKTGHKIRFKHNDIQVDNWFVERENRAECLILFILWKVIPICGESIKQAIREADWEV